MKRNLLGLAISLAFLAFLPATATVGILAATVGAVAFGINTARKLIHAVIHPEESQNVSNSNGGIIKNIVKYFRQRIRSRLEDKAAKNLYCNLSNGKWNINNFPVDMHLVKESRYNGEAVFRCDRSSKELSAHRDEKTNRILFSFRVGNSEDASQLVALIKEQGLRGVGVERDINNPGAYRVVGENPESVKLLAQAMYPPVQFNVERSVRSVNQYIVRAATYEDAVRQLQQSREAGCRPMPDSSYIHTTDNIDGIAMDRGIDGVKLNSGHLKFGEWIVEESTLSVSDAKVTLGGIEKKNYNDLVMMDSVSNNFRASLAEHNPGKSEDTPVFSDGLIGQTLNRNMELENGRTVELNRIGEVSPDGLYAIVKCNSFKEFESVVNGDVKFDGHSILFDDDVPTPDKGQYIVAVPVDRDILSRAQYLGGDADALMQRYGDLITRKDAEMSLLVDEFRTKGYTSVRLDGELDFSKAMVNGAYVNDVIDREMVQTVPSITTEAERRAWIEDAALIKNVDMRIDTKTNELIMKTSFEGGGKLLEREERKTLSDKEMYELSGRSRSITDAEMKDVVMRMYPNFFQSYHDGQGKPMYSQDVLDKFIQGKKPTKVSATKTSKTTLSNDIIKEVAKKTVLPKGVKI